MGKYWNTEILTDVLKHLRGGNLYLFAGAGLSCLAGFPSWSVLLEEFARAYRGLPRRDELLERELGTLVNKKDVVIAQHLINAEGGPEAFAATLRHQFDKSGRLKWHELLLKLSFAGYITINYDRCFEEAAKVGAAHKRLSMERWFCFPTHKKREPIDLEQMCNGERFLLHMHGCLFCDSRIDTHNIILTKEQYLKFYQELSLREICDRYLCNKAVLYMGTSLDDPWFMNKLFEIRGHHDRDFLEERETAYVILPEEERQKTERSDKLEYGFRYMYFDKDNDGLGRLIEELVEAFERPSVAEKWDPGEEPKHLHGSGGLYE